MSNIKINNVTKRFNDKLVLDNISFEIREGDIFGLIGPNGAGKSTLINIMIGHLKGNSGDVEIGGINGGASPNVPSIIVVLSKVTPFYWAMESI